MSFFIDADDKSLAQRFSKREQREPDSSYFDRVTADRKYKNNVSYILINNDLESSKTLILTLWEYRNQGGSLPKSIITQMIMCGLLLKNAAIENIMGASYDLSLGDEYYYAGKIKKLSDEEPFLTIEPYDYAIVSCKEKACLPLDVIAKFGLSVNLFCQGVILSNGPQVDPGFRGTLFCLLFNTSNRAVHIKRGKHYATIEFNKLLEPVPEYKGQYQDKEKIIEYIPANALHGAINELKKEIEQLKNESKLMQNIYLGVVSLMFAVISLLLILK